MQTTRRPLVGRGSDCLTLGTVCLNIGSHVFIYRFSASLRTLNMFNSLISLFLEGMGVLQRSYWPLLSMSARELLSRTVLFIIGPQVFTSLFSAYFGLQMCFTIYYPYFYQLRIFFLDPFWLFCKILFDDQVPRVYLCAMYYLGAMDVFNDLLSSF